MKKVSNILKDIYKVNFENLNFLECGAHTNGDETSDFNHNNNCWYIEANESDYNVLKKNKNNALNYALSDKDGLIKFTITSQAGNSSCEYTEGHINELNSYNASFKEVMVSSISYNTLLKKLNLKFDVIVLDIEGHEKTVLSSWKNIIPENLPSIVVIECGYDWEIRLNLLKELGYRPDCYYYNNCYLSKPIIDVNLEYTKQYNNEWKNFIWGKTLIYKNDLI